MYTELNVLNTFHQSRPSTVKFPLSIHDAARNLLVLTPERKRKILINPKNTQLTENN